MTSEGMSGTRNKMTGALIVGALLPVLLPALLVIPVGTSPEEVWEAILAFLTMVWTYDGVKWIVFHVLLNTVAALAVSIYTGEFILGKFFEFLYRKLLPYVLLYYVAKLVGMEVGQEWIAPACWAIIGATLLGDLADNALKLNLPLPEKVKMALSWFVKMVKANPSMQAREAYLRHYRSKF